MSENQQELLQLQTNADEQNTSKKSYLMNYQRIKEIFTIATADKNEKRVKYLLMGDYKLTDKEFKTNNEIIEYIENNKWEITLKIIGIAIELINKNEKYATK